MMLADRGHCMRALPIRENWRLQLTVNGKRRTLFLKKHHVRSWGSRLRAWLGLPAGRSAGREEAMNIRRLQSAAIPCMELAAYGQRLRSDGLLESFLLTPELEGFMQLDDFLRTRFARLNTKCCDRRDADLARLTDRVAAIARQFHEAGFNHRDLYCCHFFVRERTRGDFEIRLIDLQRVQHREQRRRRWLVKDLAQLAYSAPRDRIKCTQKMAFIRRYFGVTKLRPEHKRLIREVLAKQQAMEGKQGRIA
jgi:heptose I phosphotransferase